MYATTHTHSNEISIKRRVSQTTEVSYLPALNKQTLPYHNNLLFILNNEPIHNLSRSPANRHSRRFAR